MLGKRGLNRLGYSKYDQSGKSLKIGSSHVEYLYTLKFIGWKIGGIELNQKVTSFGKHTLGVVINVDKTARSFS